MIDDGVNKLLSRIDDGVVAVLVVRRIDGVVVINDKTDPDLPLPRAVDCTADESKGGAVEELAVDCPADESKGGAVAELAAQNVSNPGNGGRLVARDVASPLAPKYGLIGGAAASAGAAVSLSSSSSSTSSSLIPAAFLSAIASANFFVIILQAGAAVGIGSSSSRCNASADRILLLPRRHDGLRWVLLGLSC